MLTITRSTRSGRSNVQEIRAVSNSHPKSHAATLPDDVLVCRCEEISAADIRAAITAGAVSINDVKRRTRAGMGMCQGIFCVRTISHMIESEAAVPLAQIVPMTARPPARPIPLSAIAELEP
jgi:NAD(P)H-nitrite reductase large subunit